MRRRRNNAERLRTAVELLPRHTREAMLSGIDSNPIIVGAYTDRDGGVCPMLAAHRNGGRTSFASFARTWDAFTGATKRPRPASRREVRALRSYLEMSLLEEDVRGPSLTQIADRIREESRQMAARDLSTQRADGPDRAPVRSGPRPGERNRTRELRRRPRWSWLRPARRYDVYQATVAAAQEQAAEVRADQVLGSQRDRVDPAHRPIR